MTAAHSTRCVSAGALALACVALTLMSCGAGGGEPRLAPPTGFNADSAMSYVRQQLAFGPRVPGTEPV